MNIYSRARKHIDMNRVKELREEKVRKIKHEKAAEIWKQQENYFAELKKIEQKEDSRYSNWRKELKEGMTTASLGMINYPAEGDNNLENITQTATPGTPGAGGSGGSYSFGNYDGTGNGGFFLYLDTTKYDTIKLNANKGGATSISVSVGNGSFKTLSNGTNRITISSANRGQNVLFIFNAFKSGGSGATGASISGVTFQRRNPINVFVGLDDPEANSFIRDGQADNLSPKEKKKKLEEQLRSSKEYLNKMFGEGMPGTATQIADYEPQQSFSDIVSDARNPMGTGDQAFDREMTALLASPMVQAAASQGLAALAALVGGVGTAQQIMNSIRGTDWGAAPGMDKVGDWNKNPNPGLHKDLTPQQQAEVEAANKELRDAGKAWGDIRSDPDATDIQKDMAKERYDRASKNRQRLRKKHREENKNRRESYKSNGLYISENKRLKSPKDLADKIPGYYDGKPAPLGFPIVEPPKMKDGMHPDLVDGKKVAKRFNRLDPISAKAMPPTGNPHIDKKVKAAAKKPK